MPTAKPPARGTPHHDEIRRLRRVEYQVRGLQQMIGQDRYCIEILTKIRSVQRALQVVSDSILRRHLEHCVIDAVESGDATDRDARIHELMSVLVRGR